MCAIEGKAYNICQDDVHSRMPLIAECLVYDLLRQNSASSLCSLIVHKMGSMHSDVGLLTEIKSRTQSRSQCSPRCCYTLLRWFGSEKPRDRLTWTPLKSAQRTSPETFQRRRGDARHIAAEVQLTYALLDALLPLDLGREDLPPLLPSLQQENRCWSRTDT